VKVELLLKSASPQCSLNSKVINEPLFSVPTSSFHREKLRERETKGNNELMFSPKSPPERESIHLDCGTIENRS
jgi:hypothetical protein